MIMMVDLYRNANLMLFKSYSCEVYCIVSTDNFLVSVTLDW